MIYKDREMKELERIRKVFADHLEKSHDYDLVWSEKLGYAYLCDELLEDKI